MKNNPPAIPQSKLYNDMTGSFSIATLCVFLIGAAYVLDVYIFELHLHGPMTVVEGILIFGVGFFVVHGFRCWQQARVMEPVLQELMKKRDRLWKEMEKHLNEIDELEELMRQAIESQDEKLANSYQQMVLAKQRDAEYWSDLVIPVQAEIDKLMNGEKPAERREEAK